MSQGISALGPPPGSGDSSFEWVARLPDGAVSVAKVDESLVLRASEKLQEHFENLLERRKAGTLSAEDDQQYEAICALDDALSWLNRLARAAPSGS